MKEPDFIADVTWDDGRNKSVPALALRRIQAGSWFRDTPLILTAGNYAYTDVLVSSSTEDHPLITRVFPVRIHLAVPNWETYQTLPALRIP